MRDHRIDHWCCKRPRRNDCFLFYLNRDTCKSSSCFVSQGFNIEHDVDAGSTLDPKCMI